MRLSRPVDGADPPTFRRFRQQHQLSRVGVDHASPFASLRETEFRITAAPASSFSLAAFCIFAQQLCAVVAAARTGGDKHCDQRAKDRGEQQLRPGLHRERDGLRLLLLYHTARQHFPAGIRI